MQYSDQSDKSAGRPIDLVDLINFSNYWSLRLLTKPLAIPILYSLNFFNALTHNYGVAIIVFTFLFYSLLFPLRWSQSRSFKKASGNAPKMKEIQDKIKDLQKKGVPTDDPRMRAAADGAAQDDQGRAADRRLSADAAAVSAADRVLHGRDGLARYPPGVVHVAARPFGGRPVAHSRIRLRDLDDPVDEVYAEAATVTPEQQMQQKMMTYFMPVMMLWVMWSAPSGLLLYWFFGNIVSFGQQMVINRMNKTERCRRRRRSSTRCQRMRKR